MIFSLFSSSIFVSLINSKSLSVFVDEIEQHLHPQLQKTILGKLHEIFPRIQFIVTSHSPLVASSSQDIKVWRIFEGDLHSENPFGWLAEDVYEMMGIESSRSPSFFNEILNTYEKLDEKRLRGKISSDEKKIYKRLKNKLNILPGNDPIRIITEINNIKKRAEEIIRKNNR